MAEQSIHGRVKTTQRISGKISAEQAINGELDKDVKDRLYRDYNLLHNKPSIEGVELIHNKTLEDLGIERFRYGTVGYWNSDPTVIAQQGTIYVYTDYYTVDDEPVPNFKVGDGTSFLIDMPFVSAAMDDHIRDIVRHITAEERAKWNNKVSVQIAPSDSENLMFITG